MTPKRATVAPVFETVAGSAANPKPAKGSHRINDHAFLPLPYGPSELPHDLTLIIDRWEQLPPAVRDSIVMLVNASLPSSPDLGRGKS